MEEALCGLDGPGRCSISFFTLILRLTCRQAFGPSPRPELGRTLRPRARNDFSLQMRLPSYDFAFVKLLLSRRQTGTRPAGAVGLAQRMRQYANGLLPIPSPVPLSWRLFRRRAILPRTTSYPCWLSRAKHLILCSSRGYEAPLW